MKNLSKSDYQKLFLSGDIGSESNVPPVFHHDRYLRSLQDLAGIYIKHYGIPAERLLHSRLNKALGWLECSKYRILYDEAAYGKIVLSGLSSAYASTAIWDAERDFPKIPEDILKEYPPKQMALFARALNSENKLLITLEVILMDSKGKGAPYLFRFNKLRKNYELYDTRVLNNKSLKNLINSRYLVAG